MFLVSVRENALIPSPRTSPRIEMGTFSPPSLRQPGRPVPPAPRARALHSAGSLRHSPLRSARPTHTHQHPAGSHTPPRAPNTDPRPRPSPSFFALGAILARRKPKGVSRAAPHGLIPPNLAGSGRSPPHPARPSEHAGSGSTTLTDSPAHAQRCPARRRASWEL